MYKNYKFIVPDIKERTRLDKYISQFIQNSSRTKIQKYINLGNVTVNGNFVKSNYLLKPYDVIKIELPASEKQEVVAENIPLDILYEDESLMIINKPSGMVTHPAYKNYSGTLVNAIMYYAQEKNETLSTLKGFERAGIVHRLDKDTSGILVVAKDENTHRILSEQFFKHTVEREYYAIVWGIMKFKKGIIEKKLGRDKKDRKKITVMEDFEEGKMAITEYEVIEEYGFLSLVKLNLKTGRTHQIRVHLSSKGHPVFGDSTYGGRTPHNVNLTNSLKSRIKNLLEIMPRQALHAKTLGFRHPKTGIWNIFESELPIDIENLIEKLKK